MFKLQCKQKLLSQKNCLLTGNKLPLKMGKCIIITNPLEKHLGNSLLNNNNTLPSIIYIQSSLLNKEFGCNCKDLALKRVKYILLATTKEILLCY
jgi:hypothetical protein